MASKNDGLDNLPASLADYICKVAKRIRFSRKVRAEVTAELADHFSQAMRECDSENERQQLADELIAQFGDASVVGSLIRRGKKRCRPSWQKALIRTAQGFGAFIVFMFVYGFWFISGEPTVRIDYLEQVNRNSRPAVSEDQNAWPLYERAIELYSEITQYGPKSLVWNDDGRIFSPWYELPSEIDPAEHAKTIRNWVQANQPVLDQLEQASKKEHFWLEYNTSSPGIGIIHVHIPQLSRYKGLHHLVFWQGWLDFQQGNMDEGLDWIIAYLKMGKHLNRTGSTLIEQFVGIAINQLGNEVLVRALGRFEFTFEQLARVQGRLEALYADGYPRVDIEFERLLVLDILQRSFTDSGFGGGHLVPREFENFIEDKRLANAVSIVTACMIHAGRDKTLRLAHEMFDLSGDFYGLTPYQLKEKGLAGLFDEKLMGSGKYRYYFLSSLLPPMELVGEIAFRGKASHDATITILALKRWQMLKGEYPETLEELVAGGFLKEVPDDPFSARPLVYRRVADDFTLYCVGHNFTDDGGELAEDNNWPKEGDKIFWTLPKEKYRVPKKPKAAQRVRKTNL